MAQKRAAKGRGTMSRRIARMEADRRRAARRRRLKRAAQIGIPVLVIVVGAVVFLLARSGDDGSATAATDVTRDTIPTTSSTTLPAVVPTVKSCSETSGTITDTAGAQKPQYATPPVMSINPALTYTATIETSKGTIVTQLSPTIAPTAVNSFVFLARCGFYDGTIVHRVAKDFVIQGGDPTGTGTGGPGYQLPDELPPEDGYAVGAVAMANSGPNTSGSQFFIVTGPNAASLPNSYTLFGVVSQGLDVAKQIEQLPSDKPDDGRPTEPVTITKITIEEK